MGRIVEALRSGDLEESAKFYGMIAMYGAMLVAADIADFIAGKPRPVELPSYADFATDLYGQLN